MPLVVGIGAMHIDMAFKVGYILNASVLIAIALRLGCLLAKAFLQVDDALTFLLFTLSLSAGLFFLTSALGFGFLSGQPFLIGSLSFLLALLPCFGKLSGTFSLASG